MAYLPDWSVTAEPRLSQPLMLTPMPAAGWPAQVIMPEIVDVWDTCRVRVVDSLDMGIVGARSGRA